MTPAPQWKLDKLTPKYFYWHWTYRTTRRAQPIWHLVRIKRIIKKHRQALTDPGALHVAEKNGWTFLPSPPTGFWLDWAFSWDTRVRRSQDYSVCWRLEQPVLWIVCMYRPGLFVSAPPTSEPSPCLRVEKLLLDIKHCCDTSRLRVQTHEIPPLGVLQVVPLRSNRTRATK